MRTLFSRTKILRRLPFALGTGLALFIVTNGFAQSTPPLGKEALVGRWVLDTEATADATARAQFGKKTTVVPVPRQPGQPQTFRTNQVIKPFNQKEYEDTKRICLEATRADTNLLSTAVNFAPDGTGKIWGVNKSGQSFEWTLKGSQILIKNPNDQFRPLTSFTNRNQLSWVWSRGTVQTALVLKPERAQSKTPTGGSAK